MKKLMILLLALTMFLSLCACDNSASSEGAAAIVQNNVATEAATEAQVSAAVEEGFIFTVNGVAIPMHAPAADILAALGEAKSYTEQTSCAFEGLDKTYFYGNFYLETYPGADGDYTYGVWLVDDTLSTAEGIYIGATQEEVEAAYGADSFDGSNAYILTKGNSSLTIILTNGVVSSIQYDALVK